MKVALIGLDGSGKSANINMMKKDSEYGNFDFLWVRWQPSITIMLYKIKHRNDKTGVRKHDSEGVKKQNNLNKDYQRKSGIKQKIFKNSLVRTVWMKYAISDYHKQFNKKVGNCSDNRNIIFDRYYLDLFVDQGINFGYSPEKIYSEIKKYQKLFPQMDKTIYIDVSPEVCFARKDDIPNMDYLNRRYDIYKYIAKQENWIIVNGENALEDVYNNIKSIILEKCYEKK